MTQTIRVDELGTAIDRWLQNVRVSSEVALKALVLRMMENIVRRTPVDTGYARSNWQINVGPQPVWQPVGSPERVQAYSPSAAEKQVASGKIGDVYWIVNGVPYVQFLEQGSSKQAPNGMVAVTVAETTVFLNTVFRGGQR